MNRMLIVGLTIVVLALAAGGLVRAAGSGVLAELPSQQARGAVEDKAAAAGKLDRLPENIVHGTVTAMEEDEALIETKDGMTVTLIITETTVQWAPGEPPTRTVELALGDPVLAFGRPVAGQKALIANIIVVAEDEGLPKFLIRGQVVVATRQTIVIDTGQRERAISVLPRTRFFSPDRSAAPRDVRPGDTVIALGQPTELGQWIAGAVLLPDAEQLAGRKLVGKVTAVDLAAGTLTVQVGQRGEVTVVAGDDTRYRIKGIDQPTLVDIKIGDRIAADGRFEQGSQTRFLARLIAVVPTAD